MKKTILLLILILLIPPVYSAPSDFRVWAERSGLFTIGKKEIVQIYVQNLIASSASYEISYSKSAQYNLNDVSHLVQVYIPSNRINSVGQNEAGSTVATVTIIGPVTSGQVNFLVRSLGDSSENTATINFTAGLPASLPEFGIAGIFIVMIICSILFYRSKILFV